MKVKEVLIGVTLAAAVCGGLYFTQRADTGEPVAAEPVASAPATSGEVLPVHTDTGEVLPDLEASGTAVTE